MIEVTGRCEFCGREFTVQYKRRHTIARFCSTSCGKKNRAGNVKPVVIARPAVSVEEIVRRAEAEGLSYGQYVARYGV